ncbi:SDR family oxidoreductase [Hydrogenophaga palleronii]|uniref:SDR family oxidoreductase n=1 Tax=Hydrogenophaga palleronii TaxID=65655 RepID=UPI000825CEBC|nr:SDR family oxidoreductase [Hydrogenophaga palleronii]
MDLGLRGRRALVCGASKGLGRACAAALAAEGVLVTIVARGEEELRLAAHDIGCSSGMPVGYVACDITTEHGRSAALASLPHPDILVTNAGGPPPGDFRDWSRDDWLAALDANMLAPIALIRSTLDGMINRRFGRVLNITSAAVKAPIGELGLSNGARSGLTGFVAGLARTAVRHNVTINNLLPGYFETDRLKALFDARARQADIAPEAGREDELAQAPARRFGQPTEFGAACAFLASAHAGYITGQNLLMDGGAYPGTF